MWRKPPRLSLYICKDTKIVAYGVYGVALFLCSTSDQPMKTCKSPYFSLISSKSLGATYQIAPWKMKNLHGGKEKFFGGIE